MFCLEVTRHFQGIYKGGFMSRIDMFNSLKNELKNISTLSDEDLLLYYNEFCYLINDERLELLKNSHDLLDETLDERFKAQMELKRLTQVDPYNLYMWQLGNRINYNLGSIPEINDVKRTLRKLDIRIKNLTRLTKEFDLINDVLNGFELEIYKRNLSNNNEQSL